MLSMAKKADGYAKAVNRLLRKPPTAGAKKSCLTDQEEIEIKTIVGMVRQAVLNGKPKPVWALVIGNKVLGVYPDEKEPHEIAARTEGQPRLLVPLVYIPWEQIRVGGRW